MGFVDRGNIKGPAGTIDTATARTLPAGAAPVVTLGGTPSSRTMDFAIPKGDDGAQGLPGFEAVPTDLGVSQLVRLPSETQDALVAGFEAYDVQASATELADANSVFMDAAAAVVAAGKKIIRVAPGRYKAPGLHPTDILGCFIVGDGVSFDPGAWVYPFSTHEWTGQSAQKQVGTGGRGVVAFECDDAEPRHWDELFPLTKELGITIGTAWPTNNGAQWITEAHRHGWEVIAHNHDHVQFPSLTPAQIDASAQASLAAIEAATGTRENIGMVYPEHVRTDETDRILSKYFTRGRGIGEIYIYPKDGARPWLVSAYFIDTQLAGGVVSEVLKETLRNVARTDGRLVLYFHYNIGNRLTHTAGLRALIPFIRSLGIQIQNPAQVWGGRNVAADSYDETSSKWTLGGAMTRSTEQAYHGDHSFKVTTPAGAPGTGTATSGLLQIASKPGMFSVYRASVRRKNAVDVNVTAAGQGIGFTAGVTLRKVDGGVTTLATATAAPRFPLTGTVIPAADWERYGTPLYFEPATMRTNLIAGAQNLAAGSAPLYLDEIKLDLIDYVSSVKYTATLAGTGNVFVYTGVQNISRQTIVLTPLAPIVGILSYSLNGGNGIIVKSSSAADTGMQVAVTITPGASYADMALPTTGA